MYFEPPNLGRLSPLHYYSYTVSSAPLYKRAPYATAEFSLLWMIANTKQLHRMFLVLLKFFVYAIKINFEIFMPCQYIHCMIYRNNDYVTRRHYKCVHKKYVMSAISIKTHVLGNKLIQNPLTKFKILYRKIQKNTVQWKELLQYQILNNR